jgi:hypothetical protein
MNGFKHIKNNRLVFSQWSGKGYAIFASLGRVVNIAALSVDISMQSLKKAISSFIDGEDFRELTFDEYGEDVEEINQFDIGDMQLQPIVVKSEYYGKLLIIKR